MLIFLARRAWPRVLTPLGRGPGAHRALLQRLLQMLGARLSSQSLAAAGGTVIFFVALRAWPRVLAPLGRGRGPALSCNASCR